MNEVNSNILSHEGVYRTRIERQDDGGLVLVQTNTRENCDCVILPADLVAKLVALVKPSRKRSAA